MNKLFFLGTKSVKIDSIKYFSIKLKPIIDFLLLNFIKILLNYQSLKEI